MLDPAHLAFDWLARRSELTPHKKALVDLSSDRELTYRQLNQRANQLANAWQEQWGVAKGDRVAVLAKNRSEYLEALFAAAKLGAILVPLNVRLAPRELAYILNDCQPRGLLLEQEFAATVNGIENELSLEHYLVFDQPRTGQPHPYEDFIAAAGDRAPVPDQPVVLDDVWTIIYTSGTTGFPKGAMATHNAVLFNAVNTMAADVLRPSNVYLLCLPLFHTGGLNVRATPTLYIGGTVLMLKDFDPGAILKLIHEKKVDCLFFVATMWVFICQHQDFAATDFSGIKFCSSGGEPLPPWVQEAMREKGILLGSPYGLTEAGPMTTWMDPEDNLVKVGSAGQATFHTRMRVVDDEGVDLPPGQVGEIIMQGPCVTPGYWNNPEGTAQAIRDGWFYTGDLGHMDEDGYLWIKGRKKDMIISGGENIYPAEIERTLSQHPKISEVAVFGIPSEKWGMSPHAVVCPKPGQEISEEEVIQFLDGKLARYKIPKSISFMDELPKSPAGKALKRVLQEAYL